MAAAVEATCTLQEYSDVPHFQTPTLYVDDLDRCLIRSDLCTDMTLAAAADFGLSNAAIGRIQQKQAEVEAAKISFEPITDLRIELGDRFQAFVDYYTGTSNQIRPNILYDDTLAHYEQFRESHLPWMCLTQGVDELWQMIKLIGSEYQGAAIITESSDKGGFLNSITTAEGDLPVLGTDLFGNVTAVFHCEQPELTDDRSKNFKNLSPGARGNMLYRLTEPRLPGQGETVPPEVADRVRTINGLSEVVAEGSLCLATCGTQPLDDFRHPDAYRPAITSTYQHTLVYVTRTALATTLHRIDIGQAA